MYNALKNKMTSFLFHNFSISSYKAISKVNGKEEIYLRNDKIVILVEDEETGKRLFDVIKSLKNSGETISSEHVDFKVTNYVVDKYNTVQIIFADIALSFENDWERSSKINKLQELVSFVYAMQKKGYLLDSKSFNNETCKNISDFLSFFKPHGYDVENSNGCIIKYVHYVLSSGGNFDELYQPIVTEGKIYAIKDFPYFMPVIQMCYEYCANGIIPDDIIHVIQAEKEERWLDDQPYYNYLVVGNPDLSTTLPITEENERYTVYGQSIKIYKSLSPEFEEFLKDKNDFFWYIRKQVREDFCNVIINFQGKIIGYKYSFQEINNTCTVSEQSFESQREILAFVSSINTYESAIRSKKYFNYQTGKNDFNLEEDLIYSLSNKNFMIAKLEDLFNLITDDPDEFNQNLTMLFFKLLLKYIEKTYGKISDKNDFFEKKEIRYLPPIVAREFINFALGKDINLPEAATIFHNFICNNMKVAEDSLIFDSGFQYNPSKSVPFIFEKEAENKYGIKIEKDMYEHLPDGRILVTFKRRKSISSLKNDISHIKSEISNKIGDMNEYVNLINISEIIYSTELGFSDKMYLVSGYITTPVRGVPLTEDIILSFNNKEILKIAGKLMSNFGKYYIYDILIDITHDDNKDEDDFVFYINILSSSFRISKSSSYNSREFVENFFEYLKRCGYNQNAFFDVNLSSYYSIEEYLLSKVNKMDAYCEEHQIYYDSSNGICPICARTKYIVEDGFEERCEKIFEDQYAIHYKINWQFSLKVYKTDDVNMKQLEENIDFILTKSEEVRKEMLGQDCFIPNKKALNSNKEFIGYIYDSVNFGNNSFIDLKDTERLENLPRIMSLVRLIIQVKSCMNYDLGFIKNPFGNVFLSKDHKKQVQIVNVEFFRRNLGSRKTVKWVYKYICQVLDSDGYIDIDTSELCEDLNYISDLLKNCAQELKMYCPIHKIYYKSSLLFCPKCVDSKQFEKIKIDYVTASEISQRQYFNQGGESTLYLYDGDTIAKVFKEDKVNYVFKCKILSAIFAKKQILEQINSENHKFRFIIPKRLLVDKESNKILGYIMDEKVEGVSISALRDKVEVKDLGFDRKDVLEILITLGEGIQTLHDKANIYIGDLNGRNILVDTNKNVYFLDFDGMGVENIAPTFCTEGYIDPVSQKNNNITKKDDWYSFAIQAFYYLTFTHPFNGIYEEYGKSLDIPDKMERRISLLGNHKITVPAIAESWNWMSSELKKAFLNIFEGDSRKNIVPELQQQYSEMYGGEFHQPEKETIRINSKFIAKKNNPFNGEIVRVINKNSAICRIGDNYSAVVSVRGSEYNIPFHNYMEIMDILILDDYPIVFSVYRYRIVGFHVNSDTEVFSESFNYESDHVVVNGNKLYLAKEQYGENIILQISFNSSGEESRDRIKFLTKNKTLGFLAQFNSKFMLVKQNSEGKDEIYCNSEKLCDIDSSSSNSKYNILYDNTTKLWLVIDNKGNVVTIKSSNGHYKKFNIPVDISDMDVKRAVFEKGILYIPSTDCLYIINVNNNMSTKRMECDKLMTPDSRLCNFNSNGFSVITNDNLYDICKS